MSEFSAEDKLKPVQDMNDFLIRRIAELEAEITMKTAENISVMDELEQRDGLVATLEAQLAEAQKDAERLRGIAVAAKRLINQVEPKHEGSLEYRLKVAIDAAMESK